MSELLPGLILLLIALGLYLLPSFVGYRRDSQLQVGIVLLNVALGWTVVGWFAALLLALVGPAAIRARCRFCSEPVRPQATVCPHCRNDLVPATLATPSRSRP